MTDKTSILNLSTFSTSLPHKVKSFPAYIAYRVEVGMLLYYHIAVTTYVLVSMKKNVCCGS